MDPYKNIWKKTQQELQTELGKSPRATNVSMVASRIKRGNQQGAVNKLRQILSRSSVAAAVAGTAAGSSTPISSAHLNEYFKTSKANLTRKFAKTGFKPSAALIHKVALMRSHGKNDRVVMAAIEKKIAQVMAAMTAKSAKEAAEAASVRANQISAASNRVQNAETPAEAVSNLKNVLTIAANSNMKTRKSRKNRKNRK
jgi:hypothetical protein